MCTAAIAYWPKDIPGTSCAGREMVAFAGMHFGVLKRDSGTMDRFPKTIVPVMSFHGAPERSRPKQTLLADEDEKREQRERWRGLATICETHFVDRKRDRLEHCEYVWMWEIAVLSLLRCIFHYSLGYDTTAV